MDHPNSPPKQKTLLDVKRQELKQLQNELSRMQLSFDEVTSQLKKSKRIEENSKSPEASGPRRRSPPKQAKTVQRPKTAHSGISQEAIVRLKLIFQHYAAINSYLKVDTLELSNFNKLVDDCALIKTKNWRPRANLLFCSKNKSKTIDFNRFVDIVLEIAGDRYPDEDKYASLEHFVYNDVKAPENYTEERVGLWRNDIADIQIKSLFRSKKQLLTSIYNLFKTQKHPYTDRLVLPGFLSFGQEFGFIPDHMSKPEAAKLFRAVETGELFTTSLTYEDFELVCGFMAFYIYDRPEHAANCSSPYDCVEAWFQWLDLGVTVLTNGTAHLKSRAAVEFEG
jgi:hypothetical protein